MYLTQETASERSKYIRKGSIAYDFHICLCKGEYYTGYAQIRFVLDDIPNELVLDFKGKFLIRVIQNESVVQSKLIEGFIFLDIKEMKVGSNIIGVHYSNKYDNDGSGCVSFIDSSSKQYISTQFAPYYANRVFPCFDQPDLKAKMKLSVISPHDWKKVLSNETANLETQLNIEQYLMASKSQKIDQVKLYLKDKAGRMTLFPETKVLSTYLYCLVAGEYVALQLPQDHRYKNIPMSLYCIQSMYKSLHRLAPFIFEITIKSMKFYQSFFHYPFPFDKYDQIFAHEYKWGAMQNAGAVILNDKYLYRDTVSTERMFNLANIISHQLSHHWFGNLVTMKWWDDVWLNQTFATFISFLCLQKLEGKLSHFNYESAMASFFRANKRGYYHDQMVTTHPIRGPVTNTSVADSVFDGITYNKGAATMKQICFLMGQQAFGKGLSSYFHKYQWKNATIDNFLAQMQEYFHHKQFNLTQWKKMWLQQSSLNILQPKWNVNNNEKQCKFIIHQYFHTPQHPTLRFHKIKVTFFKQNCDIDTFEVLIKPVQQTQLHYDGSNNYQAVLLNDEDYSFAKISIDEVSLKFFIQKIDQIKSVLSRSLIWNSYYQMIKDARLKTHKFVEIIINSLMKEPSDSIFEQVLNDINLSISLYTPPQYHSQLNNVIFKYLYNLLTKISETQSNRLIIIRSKIILFVSSQESIQSMINWLRGQDQNLKNIQMNNLVKLQTVTKAFELTSWSIQEKQKLYSEVTSKFSSDISDCYRLCCNSLVSSEQQFYKIYQSFKDVQSKYSVDLKSYIAKGWNHPIHKQRLSKYEQVYFKDLQQISKYLNGDHLASFYEKLEPKVQDLNILINGYEQIIFPPGRQKNRIDILKKVDEFKKRKRAYQLYS